MKTNTYQAWKELGFHVKRGSKACGRNDEGQCVFSEKDVACDVIDEEEYDHPMESVLQAEVEGW